MRRFAKEKGICHFFDLGKGGIEHTLVPEQGLIGPGDIVIGGDSHSTTYTDASRADRKSTRLTPVTNAQRVCRLLLEKTNNNLRVHNTLIHIGSTNKITQI